MFVLSVTNVIPVSAGFGVAILTLGLVKVFGGGLINPGKLISQIKNLYRCFYFLLINLRLNKLTCFTKEKKANAILNM